MYVIDGEQETLSPSHKKLADQSKFNVLFKIQSQV
jgi:hypothetical protein